MENEKIVHLYPLGTLYMYIPQAQHFVNMFIVFLGGYLLRYKVEIGISYLCGGHQMCGISNV